MRVLCLFLPRFGVQLLRRDHPELRSRALVLLQGCGDAAAVTTASVDGVTCGTLAGPARRSAPSAHFMPDNASDCLDELGRLAAIVRASATPLVEVGGRDHLFVDMDGLVDHYSSELNAATRVAVILYERTRFEVRAAVAATRSEALNAARAARHSVQVLDSEYPHAESVSAPSDESLIVSFGFWAGHDSAAADRTVIRQLGRLGDIIEARRKGYRSVELQLVAADGQLATVRLRPFTPMYSADAIIRAWNDARTDVRLAGVESVIVHCSGPAADVRVRPNSSQPRTSIAPRVTRPRQMYLQASA